MRIYDRCEYHMHVVTTQAHTPRHTLTDAEWILPGGISHTHTHTHTNEKNVVDRQHETGFQSLKNKNINVNMHHNPNILCLCVCTAMSTWDHTSPFMQHTWQVCWVTQSPNWLLLTLKLYISYEILFNKSHTKHVELHGHLWWTTCYMEHTKHVTTQWENGTLRNFFVNLQGKSKRREFFFKN